ncbi:hypothetical protein J6590_029637 [Homalodisca vitripennis]|nr:hypothetical protein J6590_029637 [Homalodisca vitripennis]
MFQNSRLLLCPCFPAGFPPPVPPAITTLHPSKFSIFKRATVTIRAPRSTPHPDRPVPLTLPTPIENKLLLPCRHVLPRWGIDTWVAGSPGPRCVDIARSPQQCYAVSSTRSAAISFLSCIFELAPAQRTATAPTPQ